MDLPCQNHCHNDEHGHWHDEEYPAGELPQCNHSITCSNKCAQYHELPSISPFPGLQAKLSQAFASYAVVFLLISAYRLFRTRDSVFSMVTTAKQTLASDCLGLEKSVSTLTSFPHFAAQGVNHGLVTALDSAVSQIGYGLEAVLSGILSTIELILAFLTGTWRCFLSNLADSGIPVISEISAGGIQAIDDLNNVILGTLTLPFNDLGAIIQQRMADPQIGLQINIPVLPMQQVEFCDKALNLAQVDTLTNEFQQLIVYGTYALLTMAFLATLGNMVWIWFHHYRWQTHVSRIMQHIARLRIPRIIRQGKCSTVIDRKEPHPNPTENKKRDQDDVRMYALKVSYMTQHPLLYRMLDWSSRCLFPEDENKQSVYFWFVYYIARPEVLVCLLIGLLGIGLTYAQIALVEYGRTHWRPLLMTTITDLSDLVLGLVNEAMATSSVAFAKQTNSALTNVETDLNTNVFGGIVQAATEMNSALVSVQMTLLQGIEAVFGTSLFGKLVQAVLQCLLFNKLQMVEAGLSWIQANARISLPRVSEDVLMIDQTLVNQLVNSALSVGSQTTTTMSGRSKVPTPTSTSSGPFLQNKVHAIEDAVSKVFTTYEDELRRELPVYYGLVLVWLIVVVMGIIGAVIISAPTAGNIN
ncbi:plasma membrane fusion protein prm1 [Gryganskiella cystojenkinii]|nr:plasma membrane fusion protein prm1 [Gryganskiella cystojenkinii]